MLTVCVIINLVALFFLLKWPSIWAIRNVFISGGMAIVLSLYKIINRILYGVENKEDEQPPKT